MGKKKARKKKAPKPTSLQEDKLRKLAKYATDDDTHKSFRKNGAVKGKFRDEFDKEVKAHPGGTQDWSDITGEDKAYVEGWLDALRVELGTDDIPDATLKTRVQTQANAKGGPKNA